MSALHYGLTPKMKPISPRRSGLVAALDVGSSKVACLIARLRPHPPQQVLMRRSHAIEVQYNNFSRGGKKPRIPATDEQSVLSQLTTPARFAAGHNRAQEIIPQVVERFRAALTGTLFLDPSPRRMRPACNTARPSHAALMTLRTNRRKLTSFGMAGSAFTC